MQRFQMENLLCCLITVVFIYFNASCCVAAAYYIAPGGSDKAVGAISKPWKMVTTSALKMRPGDVAYLRGGSYFRDEQTGFPFFHHPLP